MGFSVAANDWEPYAFHINSCHIALSPRELEALFRPCGGLPRMLDELNNLPPPPEARQYIARHYAPRSTERADWMTERLFYTRENALRIDAIRGRIEEMYPSGVSEPDALRAKAALLAPLLYEAATHTNTSGVFKACHRGFGGHGRDALARITAPILLEPPVLVESPQGSTVCCENAVTFLRSRTADICYLDPPYAVHQYGSNYFMLNSIALWDRPPVSDERGVDRRLLHKAGIRADWTRTRSAFCYPATALPAMAEVVRAADCRHLIVSYSNEGLIGLEELCDLLSETGSLSVRSRGHVKYPGGKQSVRRRTSNVELVLVVDRRGRSSHGKTHQVIQAVNATRLLGRSFNPRKICLSFRVEPGGIIVEAGGAQFHLPMDHHWRFSRGALAPSFASASEADRFIDLLASCEATDAREEIEILLALAGAERDGREKKRLLRETLRLFNRLAHRKYAREFAETLQILESFATRLEDADVFLAGLARVVETAARRTRG